MPKYVVKRSRRSKAKDPGARKTNWIATAGKAKEAQRKKRRKRY